MTRYIYWAIALISLLAGGCSTLHDDAQIETPSESWVKSDRPRPVTDGDSLLMYFGYLRQLPPTQLAKELDAARQSYANSHSDFSRVRYAMVLSTPSSAVYDDVRALEAIDPLLKNQNSALHDLAFMVNAQIQEQRRGQGLQQKLEALKSLEKNLIERDGARRK